MTGRLLLCTDLDRTLIPNGPEPESPGARAHFATLVARPGVCLAMVTGRDRARVEAAIAEYQLPMPDFVIADVGTSLYAVGPGRAWQHQPAWENMIARDWHGHSAGALQALLADLAELRAQEASKQNSFKLSYYVALDADQRALSAAIRQRFSAAGIEARLVWSIDEPAAIGLLDILPARASKFHAIEALMAQQGYSDDDTVFCGDSGNDIEVLESHLPSVLVANATPEVQATALARARANGTEQQLYIARGGFMGMNGCYAAGILEGVAHYHPQAAQWLKMAAGRSAR